MARVLAIDYGDKRVGLAVTDPMQMIASRLETVHSSKLMDFLVNYLKKEEVECIVVGEPRRMNNEASEIEQRITPFVKKLKKTFPLVQVERVDERFTSKLAVQAMLDAGLKKKDRQKKELVDGVSATIILQTYLERKIL